MTVTHWIVDACPRAFEKQTLPEDVCAGRLQELRDQVIKFQTREAELKHKLAAAHAAPPDPGLLDELKTQVLQAMTTGTAATRRALLNELVAQIRVENRHTIRRWFRVPDGTLTANRQATPESPVRNLADQVDPASQHAHHASGPPESSPRSAPSTSSPAPPNGSTCPPTNY